MKGVKAMIDASPCDDDLAKKKQYPLLLCREIAICEGSQKELDWAW